MRLASSESSECVLKLQKRVGRVSLDAHIGGSSANPFTRLKLLLLKDEIDIWKCSLIYQRISVQL